MKNNKGITLIALVITIIVMLILVGVTINMAVNGGLFEKAGEAVRKTNNALKTEGQIAEGGIEIGEEWYGSIDEYLQSQGLSGTGITASSVHKNLKKYLGAKIDYGVEYTDASSYGNGEWEIFYADKDHIYIITRGHLSNGMLSSYQYTGTAEFTTENKNFESQYPAVAAGLFYKTYDPDKTPALQYEATNNSGVSNENIKYAQYLLDSTKYISYLNDFADWAIGSPTLELFVDSYNAYYPDNKVTLENPTGFGYASPLSEDNSLATGTYLNHSANTRYWLACPCEGSPGGYLMDYNGMIVYGGGSKVYCTDLADSCAFRPVVCLSSDVSINWDETISAYTITSASNS